MSAEIEIDIQKVQKEEETDNEVKFALHISYIERERWNNRMWAFMKKVTLTRFSGNQFISLQHFKLTLSDDHNRPCVITLPTSIYKTRAHVCVSV